MRISDWSSDVCSSDLSAPAWDEVKGSRTAALTPPSALRMVPLSPAMRERGIGGPPVAADLPKGSNNFAVSGAVTRDGRAIVANDMHLGLRAPGTWFRARLRYPDLRAPGGQERKSVGQGKRGSGSVDTGGGRS